MVRAIVGAILTCGIVALCAGFVMLALCVAYAFTSDPLDVWEDA